MTLQTFKIESNIFVDTLTVKMQIFYNENNTFPGDLTDISAKKASLIQAFHKLLLSWRLTRKWM